MAEENPNDLLKDTSSQEELSQSGSPSATQPTVVTPLTGEDRADKEDTQKKTKKHYAPFWNITALVAVVLTITAWVVLFYNDNTAMVICIPAVICSALGIHSRFRRCSITMLIASGVLLLVFILFWIAIKYLLG